MNAFRAFALALAVLLTCLSQAHAADPIAQARLLLAKYVESYHAFDPAVAELYSDEAVVANRRTYPDGQVRSLSLTGAQYKALLRQVMPLAKARGDISQYRNPRFSVEPGGVRIQLTRYSQLKHHTSPMSLLVGPGKDGAWVVLEEHSESVP